MNHVMQLLIQSRGCNY